MKATKILGVYMAILMISCSGDHKESDVKTSETSMYKISELPIFPDFAKPIDKAGEERKFSLEKNDGTRLAFELKSVEETLFGEKRTLIGTVTPDKKEPENAVLIIGTNGFELYFKDKGEELVLKGKKELNVGYEKPNFNFDAQTKKEFMAAAKKAGVDGEKLLRDYSGQQSNKKDNNNQFEVIIEKSPHYNLINATATLAKRELIEGEINGECGSVLPSSNDFSKQMKTDRANAVTRKTYNMEIVYMEDGFPYITCYVNVIYSFMQLGGKLGLKKEEYNQVPNLSMYRPENNDVVNYLSVFARKSKAETQLDKMRDYLGSRPHKLGNKIVRCALYNGFPWDNGALGMTYSGGIYGNDSYDAKKSSLIASDRFPNILAHECGHNLGASHVNDKNDIMYDKASKSLEHYDKENLKIIKKCIEEKW